MKKSILVLLAVLGILGSFQLGKLVRAHDLPEKPQSRMLEVSEQETTEPMLINTGSDIQTAWDNAPKTASFEETRRAMEGVVDPNKPVSPVYNGNWVYQTQAGNHFYVPQRSGTIEENGCIPTTMANLFSSTGKYVSVEEIVTIADGRFASPRGHIGGFIVACADYYGYAYANPYLLQKDGLTSDPLSGYPSWDKIRQHLQEGYVALIMIKGSGHAMAIMGYDPQYDTIGVMDSFPPSFSQMFDDPYNPRNSNKGLDLGEGLIPVRVADLAKVSSGVFFIGR